MHMICSNAVIAIDGSNDAPTFAVHQIVFNLGAIFRAKDQYRVGSYFVHNDWANVAPLVECTSQRNYHKMLTTERVIFFFPQLSTKIPLAKCTLSQVKKR